MGQGGAAALGAFPASAAGSPAEPPVVAKAATNDGLSGHDQQLLAEARSTGQKTVTVIMMADPGKTGSLGT
jgi:hypothetical protein